MYFKGKYSKIIFVLLLTVQLIACKTQEEVSVANYYRPVFDQTKEAIKNVPLTPDNLDVTVLIRSNFRVTEESITDTIQIDEEFILDNYDLNVPVEDLNAKPPIYDTFFVAKDFLFLTDFVNQLFPILPDSVLDVLYGRVDTVYADSLQADSLFVIEQTQEKDTIVVTNTVPDVSEEEESVKSEGKINNTFKGLFRKKQHDTSEKKKPGKRNGKIDTEDYNAFVESLAYGNADLDNSQPTVVEPAEIADTLFADSLIIEEPVVKKLLYTRSEILADSTRDLFDAEDILDNLLLEAPYQVGDSIHFANNYNHYLLDSVLLMVTDTVYVEVFDSTKVIKQYAFEELTKHTVDTILGNEVFYLHDEIPFWVYYPEDKDVYVKMVRVVGGDFKMGSNEFDLDERYAYNITVSNFLISKYEITNELYAYFLTDVECDSLGYVEFGNYGYTNRIKVIDLYQPETKIVRDPVSGKFVAAEGFENYPVVNVSWSGANGFCMWAKGTLPSEAEWEYAAKGGRYTKMHYVDWEHNEYKYDYNFAGSSYMNQVGWFVENSRGHAWEVGLKKPNELGIYDMSGNVWEWCYDQYDSDFYMTNNKSRNPKCQGRGIKLRVNRGGCWSSDGIYCRTTNRNFLRTDRMNPYLGFRLRLNWE